MTRNLSDLAEAEERREAVRDAAAKLLQGEWSLTRLRECVERDGVADAPALWDEMRSLAWDRIDAFAAEPEQTLGMAELCAIVEEMGRAMAPTPLVPCVVGRAVLRAAGSNRTASLPILAHAEAERSMDRCRTTVSATPTNGGYRLDGKKRFVPYGLQADLTLVSATLSGGTCSLFAIDPESTGIERKALALLDSSPCAELRINDVVVPREALVASGETAARSLRDSLSLETLARCAELVGVASRALDLAVDYAKQRIAFDRPIGSFQAVQHKLVDLRGSIEVARALYQGAASARSADERDVAVAMAAFAALDDLRKVPEGALQVFGGIGTTWEHDVHFFLRRAATLCSLMGEKAAFREEVARHLTSSA